MLTDLAGCQNHTWSRGAFHRNLEDQLQGVTCTPLAGFLQVGGPPTCLLSPLHSSSTPAISWEELQKEIRGPQEFSVPSRRSAGARPRADPIEGRLFVGGVAPLLGW